MSDDIPTIRCVPTDSPLVAEMRRLRSFPGNCAEANELIDRAIDAQIKAEAQASEEPVEDVAEDEAYCSYCGNLGVIVCRCGGDVCACENRGEYDCPHC